MHPPVRILIADDHTLLRQAVRALLQAQSDFVLVGEAADGARAFELARQLKPDILLLDLSMPGVSGMNALQQLVGLPDLRVILFTAAIEIVQMEEAFRLGVRGVVLKKSAAKVLYESIRAVMAGHYWLENRAISKPVTSENEPLVKRKSSGNQ